MLNCTAMERILHQSHTLSTFLFTCSKLFERASFYGLRAIIVIYMVSETLEMSNVDAITVYSLFMTSLMFSKIIGAFIGDLILNNKKALILGGITQAIGAFCISTPSLENLYIGMGLVVLGGGLYDSNMYSLFGKIYLNKTKLLDAGFTIFYVGINIGSFFGVLLIGYIANRYGWNWGFILSGSFMIISILFPAFSKTTNLITPNKEKVTTSKRVLKITLAFILVGVFWAIYELSSVFSYGLQMTFSEQSVFNIPKHLWNSLSTFFIIPISIVAILVWSFFHNSQFTKLTIGFILFGISIGILFLIPETPAGQHAILYLISLAFLSLSEIHVAPIIYSILTKYTNPKYLTIVISLAFIPTRLFSYVISFFSEDLYENSSLALNIAFISAIVISLGLVIYLFIRRSISTSIVKKV